MAKTRYEADATQAVRAQKSLTAALDEYDKKAGETVKKLTAAERAAKKLSEQADPTKRHAQKLNDLAVAVKKGGLSLEDAEIQAAKYNRQLDRAGMTGKRTFGSLSLAQVAKYAGGVVSVGAAAGSLKELFSSVKEEADAAEMGIRSTIDAVGELQQMSDFPGNKSQARNLVARGIAKDTTQGANLIKDLEGAGVVGLDRQFLLSKIGETKIVSSDNLATFGGKLKKAERVLSLESFEDAANKIFQTSDATDSTAAAVSKSVTKFGAGLQALDFKGEAGLAAFATVLQEAENQDIASTQLSSLLTQIDKGGLSKGTLRASVVGIKNELIRANLLSTF